MSLRDLEAPSVRTPETTALPLGHAAVPARLLRLQTGAGNRAARRWLQRRLSWHQQRIAWIHEALKGDNWESADADHPGAYYVFNGLSLDDMITVYKGLSAADRKKLEDNLSHTTGDSGRMYQAIQQAKAKAGSWWRDKSDAVAWAIDSGDFVSYPDGAYWLINPLNPVDRAKVMTFLHERRLDALIAQEAAATTAGVPNAAAIAAEARTAKQVRAGGHAAADVTAAVGSEAAGLGQMVVNTLLRAGLEAKVTALVGGASGDVALEHGFEAVITEIFARHWDTVTVRRAELRAQLRASGHPNARAALELLGPETARKADAGAALVGELWGKFREQGAAFPDITPYLTLAHLEGVWAFELGACYPAVQWMGTKLLTKAAGARSAATRLPATTVMDRIRSADRAADRSVLAGGGRVRGDEVVYRSDLATTVEQLRTAIKDGWVVHARVVSGIYLDRAAKSTPNEEHSLLIVGVSGDVFEYLDPDVSGASHPSRSFNKLYFDPAANRLSTAPDDAGFLVGDDGFQADGVHRYQVVRLFVVEPPP